MNVHNLRHMKSKASADFARQRAACFWPHQDQRSCFLTPVETDLSAADGTWKETALSSGSDAVKVIGLFCSGALWV